MHGLPVPAERILLATAYELGYAAILLLLAPRRRAAGW